MTIAPLRIISSALAFFAWSNTCLIAADPHPLAEDERKALSEKYALEEKNHSETIKVAPKNIEAYSRRGDARLFLGKFAGAVADYEKMIELDSSFDVSHWRLGIAYYYVKRFDKATRQFEIYHNHDDVDRENGIWRFMSQTQFRNMDVARKGLLKYEKTDRPPYPWLYALYAGDLEPDEVYENIDQAGFPDRYKQRVLFHAQLYVGIFLELNDRRKEALNHLRAAVANKYGRATGTYMWQVARIHHDLLAKQLSAEKVSKEKED